MLSRREFNQLVEAVKDEILGLDPVVPLSKIPKAAAKAAIGTGGKDDVATSSKGTFNAKDLKPAQKEIIVGKALGMAIGMLTSGKIGGDLGSIVSEDNYIMDGHHRWAASFICDPGAKLQATQINLPGTALVSALNVVTVGKFGKSGNPGKGNVADFTGAKLGAEIDEILENGIKGEYPKTPDEIKEALGKVPGANGDFEKGKKQMMKNADALPKKIMPGAPERVEMPVIDPDQVAGIAKGLAAGEYDLTAPYSDEVTAKLGEIKEIALRRYNAKHKAELRESYFRKIKKQRPLF